MSTLSALITPSGVLTATNTETVSNKTISGASNTITNVSLATGVTGTLPVAKGGTAVTTIPAKSILVANALDTYTTVTPGAGQSIRVNAGNTAWEAYTPGTGGGSTSWSKKTANYTAVSGDKLICDTSGGAFSITLPAGPATGDYVELTDGGNWNTNNLTVLRNGSTIEGVTDDLLVDIPGTTVQLVYSGTTWQVTATTGARGPQGITGAVTRTINYLMDGGGSIVGYSGNAPLAPIIIDFNCNILSWTLLANYDCSITVDIYKQTYAQYATSGNYGIITGGTSPFIGFGTKNQQNINWNNWNTISQGDILNIVPNVTSGNATLVTLSLKVQTI